MCMVYTHVGAAEVIDCEGLAGLALRSCGVFRVKCVSAF